MTRRPSLFRQLIRSAATRIAADPRVPNENRAALAAHAEHVIWAEWRQMFGGDVVGLRAPDIEPAARDERQQRIAEARASGQSAAEIARQERISERRVRQLWQGEARRKR